MQAAIFEGNRKINVLNHPLQRVGNKDLLIKVGACGICGTDFHIFEGKAPAKIPVILGHEYVGEVVEVGSEVDTIKVGDNIAVNPNIHCGYCQFCKQGKINLCENLKALGVTLNGGFAQYSVVPVSQAYILPKEFPLKYAAFAEPLSCCVHGIDQADIKLNDSVAIIGCGTIGLLMVQLAILKGATKIIALDISNEKLKLASSLGAEFIFNPLEKESAKNINDLTSGGVDVVIECVGNEAAAEVSLNVIKKGGKILIFGLASAGSFLKLYLQSFFHKELTIKSSLLNPFTFQTAVDLLVSSKVKVEQFNTNSISLQNNEINNLFSNSRNNSIIKHIIIPN